MASFWQVRQKLNTLNNVLVRHLVVSKKLGWFMKSHAQRLRNDERYNLTIGLRKCFRRSC